MSSVPQKQVSQRWPQRALGRPLAQLQRFRHDEGGVMVAFSMIMLLLMLMIGGIGIDIMRFEMDRARLQNTLIARFWPQRIWIMNKTRRRL